jgi:nuclear pore complex protein Nup205
LITQINEVEARKEEYPETISFIKLLNSLVSAATLSSSAPDVSIIGAAPSLSNGTAASGTSSSGIGGQELSHFTAFVVQHVLAHLWQRGYK